MLNDYTVITGATSGIGYALAEDFARRGHQLIIASRNTEKMQKMCTEFKTRFKVKVVPYTVDFSEAQGAKKLYDFCMDNAYFVTVLVNNAGVGLKAQPQIEQPLLEVQQLLNINLFTLVTLSTLFGCHMKERGYGYILNVASTAAFQPLPYAALYGASKSFVLSFSEAMHVELEDYHVGVTAVCPGITDTNFFKYGKPTIPGWLYRLISSELVAKRAVQAMYKKKPSVVPYFQHWVVAQLSRFLTRHATINLMKFVEKRRKLL